VIAEELLKLHIYYHMAKRSIEEVEVLAGMWLEDFENISADVFKDACKLHRKASQFMPTGKDILDRCADVWAERQRNIKKLEEPIPDLSPEQLKENAERVRKAMRLKPLPAKPTAEKQDLKDHAKAKLEKYKRGEDDV